MANIPCPSCGSMVVEGTRVCAACGWDFVALKRTVKPADILFQSAPVEAPAEFVDAHAPVEDLPPPPKEPDPPSWFPPEHWAKLRSTPIGKDIADAILRDPRPFVGGAAALVLALVVWIAYTFWPAPPPPVKAAAAPTSGEYVRPTAVFSTTPNVVVVIPSTATLVAMSTAAILGHPTAPVPAPAVPPAPAAPVPVPAPAQ